MSMSSAGRAGSSNGCDTKPKEREIGLTGFAVPTKICSLIGSCVMATAEHREPYESRGSRTVLGARGGAIPPRDSPRPEMLTLSISVPVCLRQQKLGGRRYFSPAPGGDLSRCSNIRCRKPRLLDHIRRPGRAASGQLDAESPRGGLKACRRGRLRRKHHRVDGVENSYFS